MHCYSLTKVRRTRRQVIVSRRCVMDRLPATRTDGPLSLTRRFGRRFNRPDQRRPTSLTTLSYLHWWVGGTTGSVPDQQLTDGRKVVGSRPTKVVCITVSTGNRLWWAARCGRLPLLPSCRLHRLHICLRLNLGGKKPSSVRRRWARQWVSLPGPSSDPSAGGLLVRPRLVVPSLYIHQTHLRFLRLTDLLKIHWLIDCLTVRSLCKPDIMNGTAYSYIACIFYLI